MAEKNISELTNEELLQEAKKMKSAAIVNALLIGFLIGIVVFSIFKNTWGFFTLIPLYFAYRLSRSKYNYQEIENLLKERNLK